jgi:hypothetical protein
MRHISRARANRAESNPRHGIMSQMVERRSSCAFTASGTARPRAWGHAITSTVTSRSTAKAGSRRRASHATNVTAPAPMAAIVSQNAARSASACADEACPMHAGLCPRLETRVHRTPAARVVPDLTVVGRERTRTVQWARESVALAPRGGERRTRNADLPLESAARRRGSDEEPHRAVEGDVAAYGCCRASSRYQPGRDGRRSGRSGARMRAARLRVGWARAE